MVHEAGETARSVVDVLKEQPLSLALVLMNAALLAYLFYSGIQANKAREHDIDLLYRNRREVAILLTRCTWPEGQPLPKAFEEDK